MAEKVICTIQIEVLDETPLSLAHALTDYYMSRNSEKIGLIMLQELAEHIEVAVRAVSRSIEEGSR